MHVLRVFGTVAAVTATTLFATGCGSSSGSSSSSTSGSTSTSTAVATGGTFSAEDSSFPDYLDPALSFTSDGLDSLWTSYTGLLTYRHASGAAGSEVVPGLATAMPVLGNGGKTYVLRLRPGLKYSDGTPVKASDPNNLPLTYILSYKPAGLVINASGVISALPPITATRSGSTASRAATAARG